MGSNGYFKREDFADPPRLEADVEWPGIDSKFRIRALTQAENRRIAVLVRQEQRERAKAEADDDVAMDPLYQRQLTVCFGLAIPDLHPDDDLDDALEFVGSLPQTMMTELADRIADLSYLDPAKAYRALFGEAASVTAGAATLLGSSSSANGSA